MSYKKKGQLTTSAQWAKHLRKVGKRYFWKGERLAEKKMIDQNLPDVNYVDKMLKLTFDELFDLIEENQFKNDIDKKIANKILEAERDWGDWKSSVNSLDEFISVLEKSTGGIVTKTSLKKLLKNYNQNLPKNAWEAESICSLIEIFDLTDEENLRNIFYRLVQSIPVTSDKPS